MILIYEKKDGKKKPLALSVEEAKRQDKELKEEGYYHRLTLDPVFLLNKMFEQKMEGAEVTKEWLKEKIKSNYGRQGHQDFAKELGYSKSTIDKMVAGFAKIQPYHSHHFRTHFELQELKKLTVLFKD